MTAAGTKTGKKESPETSDRACPPLPGCYHVFPALRSGDIREHWPNWVRDEKLESALPNPPRSGSAAFQKRPKQVDRGGEDDRPCL